jgi:hypothetical protein
MKEDFPDEGSRATLIAKNFPAMGSPDMRSKYRKCGSQALIRRAAFFMCISKVMAAAHNVRTIRNIKRLMTIAPTVQ